MYESKRIMKGHISIPAEDENPTNNSQAAQDTETNPAPLEISLPHILVSERNKQAYGNRAGQAGEERTQPCQPPAPFPHEVKAQQREEKKSRLGIRPGQQKAGAKNSR